MIRKKQPRLIVTFPTTAAAFQMEQAAREQGFSGRLIPAPRELTAGCGLAWRDEPEQEAALRALLAAKVIAHEAICVLGS